METRAFGSTGLQVPVIGQGTWKIRDTRAALDSLRRGMDLGMTHIDTAELYTGAEEIVAKAIDGHRQDVFLVSKVLPSHASRAGTVAACEASLAKLGTDHLDAYLLHWTAGEHPIAETMAGMRDLVEAGKIRHVGVSNFSVDELNEAVQALEDIPLVCNQVLYNLDDSSADGDLLAWCEANDCALVGYSPFGGTRWFSPGTPENDTLSAIGARHGRSARQVTLRYLTRRPSMFAIPKASTPEHVTENALGQDFELSADDVRAIRALLA